jgi:hypothetical protein
MDEPEDLLQLVLGMTSPSIFRELFAEAHQVPREALADWFDRKTAQFGGKDAVDTVKELVGYAARFDYQQVSDKLPRSDLPALKPFLRLMLELNRRQGREDDAGLSFKTPEAWFDDVGVRPSYEHLIFERRERSREAAERVVGVGHRAFDQALRQAKSYTASVAALPADMLAKPLAVFSISDRVTTEATVVRSVTVGVEIAKEGCARVLRDWELLDYLNGIVGMRFRRLRTSSPPPDPAGVAEAVERAQKLVADAIPELDLSFRLPIVAPLAVLWPATAPAGASGQPASDEV